MWRQWYQWFFVRAPRRMSIFDGIGILAQGTPKEGSGARIPDEMSTLDALAEAQVLNDAIVGLVAEVPGLAQTGCGTTGRCAPLDYRATFGDLADHADARALVDALAGARAAAVAAFAEGDEEVALACAALRPLLARLLNSVRGAGAALDAWDGAIDCAWTSPLEAPSGKKGSYRSYAGGAGGAAWSARAAEAVALDYAAVCAREAVARERLAAAMATSGAGDLAPRFKKAAALLRSAAGLWDAAHDGRSSPIAALDALPGGCALADGDARPAEATRGVCSGCALLCAASAQRLALASALLTGAAPDSLVARLCGGVAGRLGKSGDAARAAAPAQHGRVDRRRNRSPGRRPAFVIYLRIPLSRPNRTRFP